MKLSSAKSAAAQVRAIMLTSNVRLQATEINNLVEWISEGISDDYHNSYTVRDLRNFSRAEITRSRAGTRSVEFVVSEVNWSSMCSASKGPKDASDRLAEMSAFFNMISAIIVVLSSIK